MERAINEVRSGRLGYLAASKEYDVPKSTLERRVKDKNKRATGSNKGLGNFETVFPKPLEEELVNYILRMEEIFHGLTTVDVRLLAFQLAERNGLPHKFHSETERAGKDWLAKFLRRHSNLSIRCPEATSAARARGFYRQSVMAFFTLLESLQDKYHFEPGRIYNVDETGITTVQGVPSNVIALRGKKQVGTLTSAERGTLSTATICMNALGNYIPPMIIFPRVRMKEHLKMGAPPGSLCVVHKSGWMQTELFVTWFQHFMKHCKPCKEDPVLLVLDGHATHTKNLEVIDLARDNGVVIVCLPPHCSHRLQPLDVSFMKPLSTFYTQEVEKWLRHNPGKVVTIYQVAELFGQA
ncbi:jerky protein homolog-like [Gigantopelta aegis]|uniref:jerky protein homolog-like n=1 Tax=Gigantopelta aegis TaxID=1735272 RepID=UPI001B88B9A4|nr:jerky protein homolog-like [Gigantopelta aegis]